jgi:hypothetical protein
VVPRYLTPRIRRFDSPCWLACCKPPARLPTQGSAVGQRRRTPCIHRDARPFAWRFDKASVRRARTYLWRDKTLASERRGGACPVLPGSKTHIPRDPSVLFSGTRAPPPHETSAASMPMLMPHYKTTPAAWNRAVSPVLLFACHPSIYSGLFTPHLSPHTSIHSTAQSCIGACRSTPLSFIVWLRSGPLHEAAVATMRQCPRTVCSEPCQARTAPG